MALEWVKTGILGAVAVVVFTSVAYAVPEVRAALKARKVAHYG